VTQQFDAQRIIRLQGNNFLRDTGGESFRTENADSIQFNVPVNDAAMLNVATVGRPSSLAKTVGPKTRLRSALIPKSSAGR
jgi:hypothetical protein